MINWDMVFEDADWFHWTGITPSISAGLCDVRLEGIKKAREKGLTVSCDLNIAPSSGSEEKRPER
jgi:2-dehydro-3-deoxygluconokinase